MSSKRKTKKRHKKSDAEYIENAHNLDKFVPGLKKFRRRHKLKPSEKGWITRYVNALRFTDHLIPVNKKQYRHLKDELFIPRSPDRMDKKTGNVIPGKPVPGVRAIRLKDMSPNTKLIAVKKTSLTIASNGRVWLFWKLNKLGEKQWRKSVTKAVETTFNDPENAFPVEQIAKLAKLAFDKIKKPKAVYLWTRHGPVMKNMFRDIQTFMDWLMGTYMLAYKDTDEWMNGIAILVHGPIQQGGRV